MTPMQSKIEVHVVCTMQHYEYLDEDEEELLKEDIQELKKSFSGKKK